jgi:hypothetical protein
MNEQAELLEAALALVDQLKDAPHAVLNGACAEAIRTIEAHRPKPRLIEGWVNVYKCGRIGNTWNSEAEARINGGVGNPPIRQAHLREVTDPPKWEKWTDCDARHLYALNLEGWKCIADAHNAEMERLIAAWKGGE